MLSMHQMRTSVLKRSTNMHWKIVIEWSLKAALEADILSAQHTSLKKETVK